MARVRRLFFIGDFRDEDLRSIHLQQRMWLKGFVRLGLDVQRFSYRNVLMQYSPFSSKTLSLLVARRKCNRILASQIRNYRPDLVFIDPMKYLDAEATEQVRLAAPKAVLIGRDEDAYPEKNADRLAIARLTDMVITTGAGSFLETYKRAGVRLCAFIPNGCDPDIQYRYEVDHRWRTDILFTGKVAHSQHKVEGTRYEIIRALSQASNARVFGSWKQPRVDGLDYFHAISGAKMALSINVVNDVELYHSDRLVNYVSCGTLALAKRVPDTERLFQDRRHLRYFDDVEEFFELVEYYLCHEEERQRLAAQGMEHAHREFNCTKLARALLDLVDTGTYEAPWAVMV